MRDPVMYARQKDLMEQVKKISVDAHTLGAKPTLTAEEETQFQRMLADIHTMNKRVEDLDKLDRATDTDQRDKDIEKEKEERDKKKNPSRPQEDKAKMRDVKRSAWDTDEGYHARQRRHTQEFLDQARDFILYQSYPSDPQQRALFAQQDVSGGYLVLPEVVGDMILKKVDNLFWTLKQATVFRVPRAMSFGLPSLENNPDSGDWTTEISPILADNTMSFGKRVLQPTPVRKRLLVSERFIRLAFDAKFWSNDDSNGKGGDPTDLIWDRMAYMIAFTWELAFYLGSGTNQPLGMYVASTNGIPTTQDVLTGSSTGFTYDGLVNTKFSLKVQYQMKARWDFSRTAIANVLKLKDLNGRPLLNFQTIPGELPQLLGHGVQQSEFTPATFTTGLYVGMFGDFSKYGVAIAQDLTMKKAEELYAETGNVGIFAGAECDGMPLLAEAFARMITN